MEELVFKFLDEYLGDEIYVDESPSHFLEDEYYIIYSKKNNCEVLIIRVSQIPDYSYYWGHNRICFFVSSFFDIFVSESKELVLKWFSNKHGITGMEDIKKLIYNGGISL